MSAACAVRCVDTHARHVPRGENEPRLSPQPARRNAGARAPAECRGRSKSDAHCPRSTARHNLLGQPFRCSSQVPLWHRDSLRSLGARRGSVVTTAALSSVVVSRRFHPAALHGHRNGDCPEPVADGAPARSAAEPRRTRAREHTGPRDGPGEFSGPVRRDSGPVGAGSPGCRTPGRSGSRLRTRGVPTYDAVVVRADPVSYTVVSSAPPVSRAGGSITGGPKTQPLTA